MTVQTLLHTAHNETLQKLLGRDKFQLRKAMGHLERELLAIQLAQWDPHAAVA